MPQKKIIDKEGSSMRTVKNLNKFWMFKKDVTQPPASLPGEWEFVDLPHTWNASDGQDGGNDYYRGSCCYVRSFDRPLGDRIYLETEAAANTAEVYINGMKAGRHEGGYSIFRMDITDLLKEENNLLAILVDNSPMDHVYPQVADFTFYGGLYRGVNLIGVADSHFDLDYLGSRGITVSSEIDGGHAVLTLEAFLTNPAEDLSVCFEIRDREGRMAGRAVCPANPAVKTKLMLMNPHLWQGVEDPYLYELKAHLVRRNEVIDEVSTRFGVRSFKVDPQKGFILNGKPMPLRGVSRHQDILGAGNALTPAQHLADMELIREIGANTVRLAHYQHSQEFYDACDEAGMVVWAEIPFISVMNEDPAAHENCILQMKELIIQNYNHPSICFWGIANEITIGGERPGLAENLRALNDLTHELDPTRPTTIAQMSLVPKESPLNEITDLVSYNHYFGWYGGAMEQNEVWLDAFHEMHPQIPLGLSEYGAEGILTYHSDDPKVKDYSEDYQALYHEHMAKIIDERPWLWATHVWNMFDFGCDARDEGGIKGRNNKGLVTMDRKICKDSFYVYKAYWSSDPFVHLAGSGYSQRTGEYTDVKVYSNQPCISLYIDGELFATISGSHVFCFKCVPLTGRFTMICAVAGSQSDSITLEKTSVLPAVYTLPPEDDDDGDGAANWFKLEDYQDVKPLEIRPGYFSIKDTVGDILEHEEGGSALIQVMSAVSGMKLKRSMMGMMKDMPLEQIAGMMSGMSDSAAPQGGQDMLLILNDILNKIPK